MRFELLGPIHHVETIAAGSAIRAVPRLHKQYGSGRWRKLKGFAEVELEDGIIVTAELHWYEAHGIGKREMKIVRIVD